MPISPIDFNQLMNQARVTLVGSSDAGLKGAFYDVCTEFLNDSSAWTQDVQFLAVTTRTEYKLSVPEGQIIRLAGVATPQTPQGQAQNANTVPGGIPVPALMFDVGTVTIPAQNQDTTLVATFVCNVSLPSDRKGVPLAPDWLLPIWHVGLLDGLLGKMMLQPGKSYSNQQLATYHLKRFRDAIARARVSKLRASTNGTQAWRFPQGFSTRTQQGGVPSTGSTNERTF